WQGGGVALREHLHRVAGDLDALAVGRDVLGELAQDAVVLQQLGEGLRAGQVVDRHDLDVLAAGRGRPPEVPPDAAEPVDAYPDRHCCLLKTRWTLSSGGRTSPGDHTRGKPYRSRDDAAPAAR